MKIRIQAFTLIELLVVIVIIGILSGMSIATFKNYQEKARQARLVAFDKDATTRLRGDTASLAEVPERVYTFDRVSGTTIYNDVSNTDHATDTTSTTYHAAGSGECILGGCFEFDGNDIITIPAYQPGQGLDYSITSFFRINDDALSASPSDFQPILGNSMNTPFLGYRKRTGPNQKGGEFVHFLQFGGSQSSFMFSDPTRDIDDGKWHHIILSVNQTLTGADVADVEASLYVDGELLGTDTETNVDVSGFNSNGFLVRLGSDFATTFEGHLDQFSIFPTVYTPPE